MLCEGALNAKVPVRIVIEESEKKSLKFLGV